MFCLFVCYFICLTVWYCDRNDRNVASARFLTGIYFCDRHPVACSAPYSYHQHNCVLVFINIITWLHVSTKRWLSSCQKYKTSDWYYVKVFFSMGAFRAEVLLVLAHPLWQTYSVLQYQCNNSRLQHRWYLWIDYYYHNNLPVPM